MKCLTALQDKKCLLNVYVQPRASKNRVAGMYNNSVKICVTAPPLENRANEAVIQFVAGLFNLPKSAVSIKSGKQGRNKKVLINNLSHDAARKILAGALTTT